VPCCERPSMSAKMPESAPPEPAPPRVMIYTASLCPYCHMAKELLQAKGVTFNEIDVTGEAQLRAEMRARSGRNTVPQIWIGERHVGGCDDLYALDRTGKLDIILAAV
jgi:glutaredoxin 3